MAYKDEATRKERQPIAHRKWRKKNLERCAEDARKWRAAHPGYETAMRTPEARAKKCENQRRWAKNNPEKINIRNHNQRARKKAALGSFTVAEFKAMCAVLGGRCAICRDKAKLTADHITPLSRGGSNLIVNIQALCMPCNLKKHASMEMGHQHNLWDKVA